MEFCTSRLHNRKTSLEWLPERQQLTEKSLILLERQIAKSVRKNESVLSQSEEMAAKTTLS